jgi:hypothetical protein
MEAANLPLLELLDRWGLANAERMVVRSDQLQLVAPISSKGNSGEVWRGTLWGKEVRIDSMQGVRRRHAACIEPLANTSHELQQQRCRTQVRCVLAAWHAAPRLVTCSCWPTASQVAVKLIRIDDADDRSLDCLRREVAVLLHTVGECKQVRSS